MPQILSGIGLRESLDIAFVALFAYGIILWMKRARAGLALVGIIMLGGFYFAAWQIGLQLTAWILQGFFAVILITLVILFQPDLRQFFERIALWSLRRKADASISNETVMCLVEALTTLARRKHGALVVLAGKDPLDRHLEGGVDLNGQLSSPLVISLFDPDSVGHDGALIIEENSVAQFSVHLPLSKDFEQLGQLGTRHGAALGLAERTDACCVIVSEERGEISIARNGLLQPLGDAGDLEAELERFVRTKQSPTNNRLSLWRVLTTNWIERAVSVGLAVGLWAIFISGGEGIQAEKVAPILVDNVPSDFEMTSVQPKEVKVTLSGPRREFYVLAPGALEVRIDGFLAGLGRRTFPIGPHNVNHPEGLTVLDVTPAAVELNVTRRADDKAQQVPKQQTHP